MTNKITKVYKNGVEYDIYASGGAAGTGDVTGPSSSTDADIALFDGATGKIIKDSGKKLSNYQTALSTQTAYTSKGTATKVPTITTNTLGQVTGITETNISFPVTSVNGSTGAVTVQPTLESGTNIKTINGNSVLGSGDLTVGGITKVFTLSSTADLTNAQAAVDRLNNGGVPVIRYYSMVLYWVSGVPVSGTTNILFAYTNGAGNVSSGAWSTTRTLSFTVVAGSVTGITDNNNRIKISSTAPSSGNNSTITLVI